MRTTVNVDDDLLERLRSAAERTRMPFRQVLNHTLRLGLERLHPESTHPAYRCPTFSMGVPVSASIDKAMALAALMEDDEILRKLELRK